jgi:trehalose 6-phosphate synthase
MRAGSDADSEETELPDRRRRLVVVSNRLPVVIQPDDDGGFHVRPGSGGLVTALAPVLRDRGGLWIGWPGTSSGGALEALAGVQEREVGYTLEPVELTGEEVAGYYHGFANEVIWPLFHDLPGRCNFDPARFPVYRSVNRKFVESIVVNTAAGDYIWVQDYHLMLVADEMRRAGHARRSGFFLHIPFPPLDVFMKLPWRFEILRGLLAYDLLGLQTARDLRNLLDCLRTLVPDARVASRRTAATVGVDGHELRLGAFPIGIDQRRFSSGARSRPVEERAWYIHEDLPERKLILGVDRLDYTKGIPERIQALGRALERYPELRGNVTFIQVVVPSREDVPEYAQLKQEIERLVGQVNGRFTQSGWTPIHYIYRSLEWEELLAYYRTCEVAFITPLKDGMNLVAKEYCACSLDDGVLVLSEFAGVAAQFRSSALLVNPFDVDGMAGALHRALTMEPDERAARMRRLRRNVARQNVFWWVDAFLKAAIASDLRLFPQVEHFVPQLAAG